MAVLVSTPWWKKIPKDQLTRTRHFVVSSQFAAQYSVVPEDLRAQVDAHTHQARGGPVADFLFELTDIDGVRHEFRAESFFNRHYLQTLFVEHRELRGRKVIVPGSVVCPKQAPGPEI